MRKIFILLTALIPGYIFCETPGIIDTAFGTAGDDTVTTVIEADEDD